MKYRLENLVTGEELIVHSRSRKDAHEVGQSIWPGVLVEVCTDAEYTDRILYTRHYNQIQSSLDGIREHLTDSEYPTVINCIEHVMEHLVQLRLYFNSKLEESRLRETVPQ